MRPPLLITTLLILFVCLVVSFQVFYPKEISFFSQVNLYQQGLASSDQPLKTKMSKSESFACWLSQLGELHIVQGDTLDHRFLHDAGKEWKNVTFVEDFYLPETSDSLYFTDLMDLKSGFSAVKISDRQGKGLRTLAHLPGEIAYRLCLSHTQDKLFYLSKSDSQKNVYKLRFINLRDGSRGTLLTSTKKLDSLAFDEQQYQLLVNDPVQGQVAFTKDVDGNGILAEAVQ